MFSLDLVVVLASHAVASIADDNLLGRSPLLFAVKFVARAISQATTALQRAQVGSLFLVDLHLFRSLCGLRTRLDCNFESCVIGDATSVVSCLDSLQVVAQWESLLPSVQPAASNALSMPSRPISSPANAPQVRVVSAMHSSLAVCLVSICPDLSSQSASSYFVAHSPLAPSQRIIRCWI